MNKVINKAKNSIVKQKKIYVMLIVLTIVGMIAGSIFTTILSKVDQNLVKEQLTSFFTQIKDGKLDYANGIVNSITSNLLYCIGVWLLGISIIGLPIILLLLFMKGFITGFSVGAIISLYQWKGVALALAYVFPQHLLSLCINILLAFYATSFSIKLFSSLFLKKEINFKEAMRRYLKILCISIVGLLISSVIEIFLSPFLIKFIISFIL